MLIELDFKLSVSVSLIETLAFSHDGLNHGLTFLLRLLIRRSRVLLGMQTVLFTAGSFERLFEATSQSGCV